MKIMAIIQQLIFGKLQIVFFFLVLLMFLARFKGSVSGYPDFPIHIDSISIGLFIMYFKGSQVNFLNYHVYLSLTDV